MGIKKISMIGGIVVGFLLLGFVIWIFINKTNQQNTASTQINDLNPTTQLLEVLVTKIITEPTTSLIVQIVRPTTSSYESSIKNIIITPETRFYLSDSVTKKETLADINILSANDNYVIAIWVNVSSDINIDTQKEFTAKTIKKVTIPPITTN